MFDNTRNNIFSALSRYSLASEENYLTEAFVFVLNHLLDKERKVGIGILTHLCLNANEPSFDPNETIYVLTQKSTEIGRPDIEISSSNKLIYVEVKHDSGLGETQLERYTDLLKSSNATIKHVILLTRFAVDFDEQQAKPHKHVRWYEIHNWLSKVKVEDPVSEYLINSFVNFLEVKQMSVQKVNWEYINGVPALTNLINMIEVAIKAVDLKDIKKSPAWGWRGFYIQNMEFFCGIYYDEPLFLVFEIEDKTLFDKNAVSTPSYPVREKDKCIQFLLDLEPTHFFSLDKDKQLEEITIFIKKSFADAQRMKK